MNWLFLIIGFIIGFVPITIYYFKKPRADYKKEIAAQQSILNETKAQIQNRQIARTAIEHEIRNREKDKEQLIKQINELITSLNSLRETADKTAKSFYENSMKAATSYYANDIAEMQEKFNAAQEAVKNEYIQMEKELVDKYNTRLSDITQLLEEENQQYFELHSKVQAAIEVNKRAELDKNQKEFYRLQLSKEDIAEIAKLREIEPYLKDKTALNKVIWSVYYKKPTSDLIGRVVGNKQRTVIYKLTDLTSGKCYIGQAIDVGSRWTQHIKRGVGAESATKNKLYPAMKEIGPENFMFEIIEDSAAADLNKKELEWQEFYGAKEFGYSMR